MPRCFSRRLLISRNWRSKGSLVLDDGIRDHGVDGGEPYQPNWPDITSLHGLNDEGHRRTTADRRVVPVGTGESLCGVGRTATF